MCFKFMAAVARPKTVNRPTVRSAVVHLCLFGLAFGALHLAPRYSTLRCRADTLGTARGHVRSLAVFELNNEGILPNGSPIIT